MRVDRVLALPRAADVAVSADAAAAEAGGSRGCPRSPGERAGARRRGVRPRHVAGPGWTCATRLAAAARAARRRASPAVVVDHAPRSASTTPASRGRARPWRFIERGHPSVSGPASSAEPRRRWTPLARPARVPGRPRAARRGHLVPAVAAPRRGARAVERAGHRRPRPRRDRPGARAARGAAGRRDRRRPRHRAGDRARGPRRPPGARRSSSRSRRPSTRPPASRRPSPTNAGRSCASSARELHPLPALRSTLARSFDPVGELLDTASPRLGGLRAAVRVAYDRLRRRLDALVGSELGSALQEPIVTLRNGRYVVPVKAEARSRVKGIVHDASGSGQTLFIEPLVAVELGNAWREAQVAEQEEIARILDELSALRRGQRRAAARDARGARPVRPLGGQGAARRGDGRRSRAETADRSEVDPPVGAPSRASPAASSRSTSGSATATRRSS